MIQTMEHFISPCDSERGRIRVGFLVTQLRCGGAETALLTLLDLMDRRVFKPVVICTGELGDLGHELLRRGTTDMFWCVAKSALNPMRLGRVSTLVRQLGIDILCDAITQAQTQVLSIFTKVRVGIPVVAWVHNTGRMIPRSHQEILARVCLPQYDKVIAVGSAQSEFLRRAYGIRKKRIAIVHNGIQVGRFSKLPSTEDAKTALGIDPTRPVLGITAQLRPEKNHECLLEAVRLLLSDIPDLLVLVVGDGSRGPVLRKLAQDLGIGANVWFLGQRSDVPEIVASFDVGVLCSRPAVETLPVAVLEYMAAGKPTVATDVGSVSDLVLPNKTGYLVPWGSPSALAERVRELIRQPAKAIQMGAKAAEIVRSRFTADRMNLGMEQVLLEVVGCDLATPEIASNEARTADVGANQSLLPSSHDAYSGEHRP